MFSPSITRWWPALPSGWYGTNVAALVVAIVCCWVFAFALLATFVWTSWVSVGLLRLVWWSLAILWIGGVVYNHFIWKPAPTRGPLEEFRHAQQQYLQGQWFEAEVTLKKILRNNPLDGEVLLLLAAVRRRAGKQRAARETLNQLEMLDAGTVWQFEMAAERQLLARQDEEPAPEQHAADSELPAGDAGELAPESEKSQNS